jgi:hypothetical protein
MNPFGRVIGGVYMNSTVTTATFGSDMVIQTGIKGRRLTAETVEAWQETPIEAKDGTFTAMGKAAAGVALPGRFGRAASAAVEAAFDSKAPAHRVRVTWIDGKQSLLKLPNALFTHLELVLGERRLPNEDLPLAPQVGVQEDGTTVADKAFDLVAGLVKDHFPSKKQEPLELAESPAAQMDVAEQLQKLASLRDAGILTDAEFATKKADLLERL